MTRLLTDSFTETSDKLLSAHAPDTGGAWALFSSATMSVVAAEGRVRGSDAATGSVYYNAGVSAANVAVAATVRRTTTTGNDCNPGVIARLQDVADSRYIASHNGSTLTLQKRVGGATTTLGSWSPSFPANTDCTLELRVNGSDLTALWNGVAYTASDAAVSGAGYVGVAGRLNGRLDNLTVDTIAWTLAPAKATQAASSDTAVIGVGYAVAPARAAHAVSSDPAGLGIAYAIGPANGAHAGSADAAVIGVGYALAPARGVHGISGDTPGLAFIAPLRPDDTVLPATSDAATVRRALSPPAAGIALSIAADRRTATIEHDQRTEEIHHG